MHALRFWHTKQLAILLTQLAHVLLGIRANPVAQTLQEELLKQAMQLGMAVEQF
jgi:hypothetical protein